MKSFRGHPGWPSVGLPLLALACGCGSPGAQAEQPGQLGNGTFRYECASQTGDPYCADPSLAGLSFDHISVALGGAFALSFDSSNPSYPAETTLAVSRDDLLSDGADDFTAIRTGTPSIYARTPAGDVLDIATITVASVHSIKVRDVTSLFPGDSGRAHSYGATAMQMAGVSLAGEVPYVWSTSDPTVLEIVPGQALPASTIDTRWGKDGMATLTASFGTAKGSMTVTVSGGGQ